MDDVKKPIRDALETLKELQSYESSYANINKIQQVVNRFAELERVCDMLAEALAEVEGRSKDEVLTDYYGKTGI